MKLAPNSRRHAPKRFRIQTTYCQAKLPTVRQSYLLSGKLPTIRHAPKRSRILCTQQPHTLYPTVSAYMHPKGIDMHPTTSYFAPKSFRRDAPNNCTRCTQQPHTLHPTVSAYMHPKSAYMHPRVSAYMHPKFSAYMHLISNAFENCRFVN